MKYQLLACGARPLLENIKQGMAKLEACVLPAREIARQTNEPDRVKEVKTARLNLRIAVAK
jgi:hypothetical protein